MAVNLSSEDVKASEIEEIGPEKMGESKGAMAFPRSAKTVARGIMNQRRFAGVPKRWRGGGDYFFETQEDGSLKVTGGDKASSLTGGKSVTITDQDSISKILEKARGGDILEENVSYKAEERETEADFLASAEPEGLRRLQASRRHEDILEKERQEKPPQVSDVSFAQESELDVEEKERLGESESDEVVIGLRELGMSDEDIEDIPEVSRAQFLRLATRYRK